MIKQQALAESDWIRQAQSGSQDAYSQLYQQHLPAIYRYIDKRVAGSSEAEDLTQTVFLKAWQSLRDYQPSATPFRAWLYRIAHNTVIDHYRRPAHHRGQSAPIAYDELVPLHDPQAAPEQRLLDGERRETIRRAIATLRPTYQAVLTRRFFHEMDYAETAAELGQQVNHVRVLQHRALEALRSVLSQEILWAVTMAFILLLGGRKLVVTTLRSLPGDGLYPLRTAAEATSLWIADSNGIVRLHTEFAEQRLRELRQLAQQSRTQEIPNTALRLADHIKAATAQLARNARTAQGKEATERQAFTTALQNQAAALATLAATNPPALQTSLQPAFTAINEAEHLLNAPQAVPSPESTSPPAELTPSIKVRTTVTVSVPTPAAIVATVPVAAATPTPVVTAQLDRATALAQPEQVHKHSPKSGQTATSAPLSAQQPTAQMQVQSAQAATPTATASEHQADTAPPATSTAQPPPDEHHAAEPEATNAPAVPQEHDQNQGAAASPSIHVQKTAEDNQGQHNSQTQEQSSTFNPDHAPESHEGHKRRKP